MPNFKDVRDWIEWQIGQNSAYERFTEEDVDLLYKHQKAEGVGIWKKHNAGREVPSFPPVTLLEPNQYLLYLPTIIFKQKGKEEEFEELARTDRVLKHYCNNSAVDLPLGEIELTLSEVIREGCPRPGAPGHEEWMEERRHEIEEDFEKSSGMLTAW